MLTILNAVNPWLIHFNSITRHGIHSILFSFFIVLSTVSDPVPGWIESWNGPTGIVSAACKGVYNSFYCHRWAYVDMIPADIVVNLLICAAWDTAHQKYVLYRAKFISRIDNHELS